LLILVHNEYARKEEPMSNIENAEENVTSSEHADKTMTGVYCTYPAGHKRARCGECAGCTASSCKICKYCCDSPKFDQAN